MPFGLINARATFQRAMDVAFHDYINKFMVVYQDDLKLIPRRLRNIVSIWKRFSLNLWNMEYH